MKDHKNYFVASNGTIVYLCEACSRPIGDHTWAMRGYEGIYLHQDCCKPPKVDKNFKPFRGIIPRKVERGKKAKVKKRRMMEKKGQMSMF